MIRPGIYGGVHCINRGEAREKNPSNARLQFTDSPTQFCPIHAWHAVIEDDYIIRLLFDQR